MPTEARTIPIGTPKVPGRIVEGLREAIADPKRRPGAYIRLSAAGGVHGEAYEFEYRIDASGVATSRLLDELKGRRHAEPASREKAADPARFAQLARAIDIEALMRAEAEAITGGFPPDSVVARLEVSDGEQTVSFLFMADDAQATRARTIAPDPVRRAADALYRAAATHLATEDVRP